MALWASSNILQICHVPRQILMIISYCVTWKILESSLFHLAEFMALKLLKNFKSLRL